MLAKLMLWLPGGVAVEQTSTDREDAGAFLDQSALRRLDVRELGTGAPSNIVERALHRASS